MFNNVIMPDVSVSEMRGVLALLDLIHNPKAKAAAEFLEKLSQEKHAAVEAAAKASADVATAAASFEQAQKLHDDLEKRLEKKIKEYELKLTLLDDRTRNLKEDERALAEQKTALTNDINRHYRENESRQPELLRRENALVAREEKLEKDIADLKRRQDEFNKILHSIGQVAS